MRFESEVAKIVDSRRVKEADMCHHNCLNRIDGTLLSMASAEQLIHEAQYAFHSISFGEEAYSSKLNLIHWHVAQSTHHPKAMSITPDGYAKKRIDSIS